jgi:hypothetical protein
LVLFACPTLLDTYRLYHQTKSRNNLIEVVLE